jgi:outer membrane immunogenic protein
VFKSVASGIAGFSLIAAAAASSPARAEGLPTYMPPQEYVAAPPAWVWDGIYVGFQGGFAWTDTDWRFQNVSHFNDFVGDRISPNPSGGVFGGQVGFNKQIGRFVWGLEGTVAGADIRESSRSPFFVEDRLHTDIDLIWTVTGRLGYAWGPAMTYVKGGYAGANISISARDPITPVRARDEETHNGWTVGAGVEYLISPQIVLGVEYNFMDFGERSHRTFASDATPFAVDTDVSAQVVLARLSYKFTRDIYVPVPYK